MAGLCVLRDDDSGVPHEILRSLEDLFLERRPAIDSGEPWPPGIVRRLDRNKQEPEAPASGPATESHEAPF